MELKYYIFFLGAGFSLLAAVWAAASPRMARLAFALFLLSTLYMIDINFASHEWYKGSTRGFELSVTDLLLIILVISLFVQRKLLGQEDGHIQWLPKGSIPILVFMAIATLSLTAADNRLYGLFELSKMVKGFLIFWVVANYVTTPQLVRLAFTTFCILAGFEIAYGALQHFSRIYRIPGTLGHPNSLAMYMNMLIPLFLANALHSGARRALILLPLITGGVTVVILTFSRGGWVGLAVALSIVMAVSLWQEPSRRLMGALAISVIAVSAIVYKELPHM
ncbi:MAG: hypothetical protein V3U33_09610, partial [candidate division NC10 bacterium]